ncbi:hypothetical protein J5Y03_15945 [Bacillus sp. RG28]|uniref:Hydrolase n=1 Tax=Gottfriedia endophytica TaxID=2820819 RepID=A0A940NPY5_9BACI|nr:hypothetical protein [Gottfriedia endophytica]MBP0726651.1 hypothetical protein [Gottfriedia endophytica]
MDKTRYYVSVQAKTITINQGDAAYELEIDATQDDVERLKQLFNNMDHNDFVSGFRTVLGISMPYHLDEPNDRYDNNIKDVYRMLHNLGTAETKQHIREMHILN